MNRQPTIQKLFSSIGRALRSAGTVALFGAIAGPMCFAETRVGGLLNGENQWDAEHGPYIVESDVIVTRFAQLTIAPGTTIIIDTGKGKDASLPQINALDSMSIAIKIEGALVCIGQKDKRISFASAYPSGDRLGWFGIVISKASAESTKLCFCDISGAYNGVTIYECKPLIRNSVFERNNIGINCLKNGSALVSNCICTGNFTAGIRVQKAGPHITGSLVVFNRNDGLWCDSCSAVTFDYNCCFGNGDGDYLGCDPRLGRNVSVNRNKDSVDYAGNLSCNPVFAGSSADSAAFLRECKQATTMAKVKKDTVAISRVDSAATDYLAKKRPPYSLSRYSPCINAGNLRACFNDPKSPPSDMGVFGGPEFVNSDR